MNIGISTYDVPITEFLAMVSAGEQAGFDGVWLGEHVVAPIAYDSSHPTQAGSADVKGRAEHDGKPIVDLSVELLDPLLALTAAAVRTRSFRLATGIYLLGLRHPLLTARAGVTLHDLSDGRFRLGIGAGWLKEEFAALDAPFAGRIGRLEEAIEILRAAWAGGPFAYSGSYYSIAELQVATHAIDVPIVMGGNSEPALRRAARLGDGWFTSGVPSFEDAMRLRDQLDALCTKLGRARPLQTTWRIHAADPALVDKYRAEGFENLLVMQHSVWNGADLDSRLQGLRRAGAELGLQPATT
jgi:probable F420-dependent oxidoreductase